MVEQPALADERGRCRLRLVVQDPPHVRHRSPGTPRFVAAGERFFVPKTAPAPVAEKVPLEALRAALAWHGRLADFADAPLGAVIERFNARSRVQLILADPELAARPVGGTFHLDEAGAFVRLLEREGEIVAERRGEHEILLRRAP